MTSTVVAPADRAASRTRERASSTSRLAPERAVVVGPVSRARPVWAAAFQALIVTSHVMLAVDLRPPADAVAAVNNLANYGVLIAMAVGTFWTWQERRALQPL